ncbi:MAG: sporulation integral membrane protein YtvI [Schaedlerella sp.]|nr:sporulation integral membrane protein YtvI [Schaedlerella sp.]
MNNTRPYWQVFVSLVFSLLATAAFVIIGIKAIGFFMPFVIGWIIALIASPIVNWLEKRFKIVKKLGTAIVVVFVIALIVFLIYIICARLWIEIKGFAQNIPELYAQLDAGFTQIGKTLSGIFEKLPEGVQINWNELVESISTSIGSLISNIGEPTVEAAGNIAKSLPSILISVVIALISSYFFTVQKEEVIQWVKKVSPPSVKMRMGLVADNLRYAVGGYFKAQFKIMAIVFVILVIGFAMLKVSYFGLVALLVAFLDFLPFFGTGTALFPWAAYKLLIGDYKFAIMLIVIYVITQAGRQLLQPKMVADSMGMNPIVTLIFLYIGYKVKGVTGMILAVPIGLVLLNMCEAGAFDYIFDDIRILVDGILGLRETNKE